MGNSFLVVLRRQWFVVAAAVVVFIAAWAGYLCVTTPLYTSTARLRVQRAGGGGGGVGGAPSASAGATASGSSITGAPADAESADNDLDFLEAQADLLASTPVLAIAASDPSLAELPRLHRAADPVEWLRRSLGVDVARRDAQIAVSFDATDPQVADRVLTAVIGAYRRYVAAQRHSPASGLIEMLADERRQREADLARKGQQLLEHARKHGRPTTAAAALAAAGDADGSGPVARRLAVVSDALAAAQRAVVEAAAARQEVVQTILTNPKYAAELAELRNAATDADPAAVRAEQEHVRGELRLLRQRYLPGHPALEAAQRDLDRLELAYAVAVDERYERAKRLEADARRVFDEIQKDAREQRARAAEYAWLEAEVSVARRQLEALECKIKEATLRDEASAPRIDVLASPRAAPEPTKPQPGRTAGLALIVGLLTGAALAGARDAYSARLRSPGDAESALGLPVLARIPDVPGLANAAPILPVRQEDGAVPASASPASSNGDGKGSGEGNASASGTATGTGNGCGKGNGNESGSELPELGITEPDPFGAVAVAYLALRNPGGSDRQDTADVTDEEYRRPRDRTILVTSSAPREGKSTVASRLAVDLARSGLRILLIDANLRRPVQQALFGLGRGPGLADVLAGRATLDAAIRQTAVAKLEVLAAGRTAADPLVLLNRAELVDVLERVAEAYDHVIVDSPAVRVGADARVIAAACDATLLVLRNTDAGVRMGIHARDGLAVVGANIVGVILNTVPQPAAPTQDDREGSPRRRQRPASPLDAQPVS